MTRHLPTYLSGNWSVTEFRDSLTALLHNDRSATALKMFFYAVTNTGWDQIRKQVRRWQAGAKGRSVILVAGTDHAITDPAALTRIQDDGVEVRVMREYEGVFHPKVVWLQGARSHTVWVASNNLTRDGLLNNVEFAIVVTSKKMPASLRRWARAVEAGSANLTRDLLASYEQEREAFEAVRAKAKATTFTWSRKTQPTRARNVTPTRPGDVIVEVMPKETGSGGKQLQLPIAAASVVFGLKGVGATRTIRMRSSDGGSLRALTMTVFSNNTVRLSIADLEYRDRPCVIVFHKVNASTFEYAIVAQSIFPEHYLSLLARCNRQTRADSRRWGVM